LRRWKHNRGKY